LVFFFFGGFVVGESAVTAFGASSFGVELAWDFGVRLAVVGVFIHSFIGL
jgi:hypothetical protein